MIFIRSELPPLSAIDAKLSPESKPSVDGGDQFSLSNFFAGLNGDYRLWFLCFALSHLIVAICFLIFPEKKRKESAFDKMIFKHPHITVSILFGMIAVKTLFIGIITPPGLRYPLASVQSSQHVALGAHDHYDFPIDMVYLWAGDISEAQALVEDKIFNILQRTCN